MRRNVIVGQSGGPTAAINSSLAGVYRTAKDRGANKVYGMLHGVQGLLQERYLDLSEYITTELDAELLKRTPAAFLGSCRYKLPEIHEDRAVYEKIFGILDKLDIEAFIYIGGNDSMDTIKKLSDYAIVTGHPTRFIGCPKTIDNDLALTDHTPGYGSAAKYIGTSVKEIIRDSFCLEYSKGLVSIVEIMGRNAGWLTGAAALSKGEDCEGPDSSILVLGGFYVLVFLAYLFFEFFVVNYRPVLIEGVLEASYPSSTTMLMMCIMPTAIMQFHHLISSKRLRNIVNAFCGIYASFMVIGRVLSGVHWFTDIVGGILLSATLVMLYYSTNQLVNSKASRSSQRSR